jgi:hypothetical protein
MNKEEKGNSPNIREPEDLVHLAEEITRHKGKMHDTSLHKAG